MSILGSKLRQKIYRHYFTSPESEFYVRELAKILEEDPGNLAKELKKIEKEGIFISQKRGSGKYYALNKKYFLYRELKNIVFKTIGIEGSLKKIVSNTKGIEIAFIFGSYAKQKENSKSDIDLFIIGKLDEEEFSVIIYDLEKKINREINTHYYDRKSLNRKIKEKNSFIKNILNDKKIMLKGEENDLPKFS